MALKLQVDDAGDSSLLDRIQSPQTHSMNDPHQVQDTEKKEKTMNISPESALLSVVTVALLEMFYTFSR